MKRCARSRPFAFHGGVGYSDASRLNAPLTVVREGKNPIMGRPRCHLSTPATYLSCLSPPLSRTTWTDGLVGGLCSASDRQARGPLSPACWLDCVGRLSHTLGRTSRPNAEAAKDAKKDIVSQRPSRPLRSIVASVTRTRSYRAIHMHLLEPSCARRMWSAAVAIAVVSRAVTIIAAQRTVDLPGPASFTVVEATIDDVQAALRARKLTCRRLVELYLERIHAYDKAGPALNAVQTINPRAVQEAEQLDAAFSASGPAGPLHCVAVLVKDQIDTSDMPTTHGFVGFKDFVPAADATIVTRLKRAGALILGKATMGEFASGYLSSASGPIRSSMPTWRG